MMEEKKKDNSDFINPIDKDKVAEKPNLLPYAHTVGGVAIRPVDRGKIKARALTAMEEQTKNQLKQIYEQIEVLAKQAKEIQKRVDVSNWIYGAEMGFEPLVSQVYHLYLKGEDKHILSIIGPDEWGRNGCPYDRFIASVKMLADHTWQVLD